MLLGGTGDETFHARRWLIAAPLAMAHGVACFSLCYPYYGSRRGNGQFRFFLKKVGDMGRMGAAIMVEAANLVRWIRAQPKFKDLPVALSGFSMGGAMACAAGCISEGPIAIVPCMGSANPSPLVKGPLSALCNWNAFLSHPGFPQGIAPENVRALVLKYLLRADIADTIDRFPKANIGKRVLVQIQGKWDGFVTAAAGEELYEKVSPTAQTAEIHWVECGHSFALLLAPWIFVPAIAHGLNLISEDSMRTTLTNHVAFGTREEPSQQHK